MIALCNHSCELFVVFKVVKCIQKATTVNTRSVEMGDDMAFGYEFIAMIVLSCCQRLCGKNMLYFHGLKE